VAKAEERLWLHTLDCQLSRIYRNGETNHKFMASCEKYKGPFQVTNIETAKISAIGQVVYMVHTNALKRKSHD